MRVYDQKDENGRVVAFQVGNTFLTRRGLCKIVRSIPEVRVLKAPVSFSFWKSEDEFCEFEFQGERFVAWEPFDDNSRYWIGTIPPHSGQQVEIVRDAFVRHKWLKFLK
jgi:hypothetical protein